MKEKQLQSDHPDACDKSHWDIWINRILTIFMIAVVAWGVKVNFDGVQINQELYQFQIQAGRPHLSVHSIYITQHNTDLDLQFQVTNSGQRAASDVTFSIEFHDQVDGTEALLTQPVSYANSIPPNNTENYREDLGALLDYSDTIYVVIDVTCIDELSGQTLTWPYTYKFESERLAYGGQIGLDRLSISERVSILSD